MPTILLIRHAQASFGAADYDVLSPLAPAQIAALETALTRRGLADARTVSGPLLRQRQTAALGLPERPIEIDPRWVEYDSDAVLGAHSQVVASLAAEPGTEPLTSRAFQDILDPALAAWIAAGEDSPSRQTWTAFLGGALAALDELAGSLGKGETALVFTSAGTIAAVCSALLGQPDAFIPFNRVQINTAISKLAVGRSGTTLVSFNEHGHLDDAGPGLVTMR